MRHLRSICMLALVICVLTGFEGVALSMGSRPQRLDYNLLLITIDTLRADHLACYGYKHIKTPNIDRLAGEGVIFSQAITPVPITLPSHTCMMTGLYPVQHGVRNNGNFFLSDEALTLAEIMKGYGYKTGACVGSFVLDSIFGLDQGFDYYDDNFNPGKKRVSSLYNERKASDVNRAGIKWLEGHKDNRFFLWLHYYDPHSPYFPPFPYTLDYRDSLYDGEIAYVDACLGELFGEMKAMGLMENTVIILAADHGEGLGEHNELTHAVFIYDATIRVPLIINAPGVLKKGRDVTAMVSTIDITPTVLDLFGLKPIKGLSGKSLIPLVYEKVDAVHDRLLCESLCPELSFGWSRLEGIRTPEWKYIQAPVSELYQISRDRGELINMLQVEAEQHAVWKQELESVKKSHPPVFEEEVATKMDPETEQRLKSLGYIWTKAETGAEGEKERPDPKDRIHIMNYLDDGMGFLLLGLYEQAIKEFDKIVREDPENMAAYFNLGSAYEEWGEYDEAEKYFNKMIEIDPEHSDVHNHLGLIHYHRGNWDLALNEFQISADLFAYAEVYYNLSLVYQKKDRIEEAIDAIGKAIDLDPDYAEAWNQAGNLYMARHDLIGSSERFKKAIELDPEHVTAHNNLGLIYSQQGMIDAAIEQFQLAVKYDPESAESHNNLGSLYIGQRQYDKAESELKEALRIRPDYQKAMINMGMLYAGQNRQKEAEGLFLKALEIDDNCADAYSQLGYLYMMKQDFDGALSAYLKVLALAPDDPRIYYDLGKAYQSLGRTEAAIKAWQKALVLQPGLAGAHLNLGNAYFEMGDFQTAQREWEQALAGRSVDVSTHLVNLGLLYFQSKQYDRAAHALKKAVELKPGDPNIHYNLAVAYFQQGLYPEADQELREYLRIQPDSQNAHMLLERIDSLMQK